MKAVFKPRLSVTDADKNALSTYDRLKAFCEHELGIGRRRGNDLLFPCPFGTHRRPHLSIGVRNGRGVWRCRACDVGGDVFKLAIMMRGASFPAAVAHVAEVTGYALHDAPPLSREDRVRAAREQYTRRCQKARQDTLNALRRPEPAAAVFLTGAREAEAWGYLERAKRPGALDKHAAALAISADRLRIHADFPERGGLGLAIDGRLIYIYTARDETGRIRPVALKARNAPGSGARFQFLAGKPCIPFGAARINCGTGVILTEGESDALAVGAALEYYREAWETGPEPGEEPGIPLDALPVVVAAPGTSGFAAACPWLYGRRVMICRDNDTPGEMAANSLASSLCEPIVRIWAPPPGVKDARAAYTAAVSPYLFAEELLTVFYS